MDVLINLILYALIYFACGLSFYFLYLRACKRLYFTYLKYLRSRKGLSLNEKKEGKIKFISFLNDTLRYKKAIVCAWPIYFILTVRMYFFGDNQMGV